MPQVYKVRACPPDAVFIGRGKNPWGNPFHIGKDGSREDVIRKFRLYAEDRLLREPEWLVPLRDKDVTCFCAPLACHGDVLVELANR